jgi:hypothetical protein
MLLSASSLPVQTFSLSHFIIPPHLSACSIHPIVTQQDDSF